MYVNGMDMHFSVGQYHKFAMAVIKEKTGETVKAVKFSTNIKYPDGKIAEIWLPKSVLESNGKLTYKAEQMVLRKSFELKEKYNADLCV